MKMNAQHVLHTLMSSRHANDVCVPECKDGSTMGRRNHFRLDLWAMNRSWSNWCTFGYEIKVSRSDFLRDEKWHNYLDLCHQFYFVTPWKLVMPEEVPGAAGLIWVSKNLSRCYVKKKAEKRAIEPPAELLTYILMSRARIGAPVWGAMTGEADKLAHAQNWLKKRGELKDLGYGIAAQASQEVENFRRENVKLRLENDRLGEIKQFWIEHLKCREGELINAYHSSIQQTNEIKARQLAELVPHESLRALRELVSHLKRSYQNTEALLDKLET